MPKASRGRRPAPNQKKRTQRETPRYVTAGLVASAAQVAPSAVAPVAASAGRVVPPRRAGVPLPRRRFQDSVADYWYVARDLRQIGITAGSLVVLLVVLSFVLR